MPSNSSIDAADLRILEVLQDDAALSVSQVAERVNLSQNACWRRMKRLDEEGWVRRRVALLDSVKLGVGVVVFASVRAAEHSEAWLTHFAAVVRRIPRSSKSTA